MEIVELGMDVGILASVAGLGILVLPWSDVELGASTRAIGGAWGALRRMVAGLGRRPILAPVRVA
jgi:hypothetical protein